MVYEECPKGQYQDKPGQQTCKQCSRGRYQTQPASKSW